MRYYRYRQTGPNTWLVTTTSVGYVLVAFVGIWLSFSAKYIKQILANFALYFHVGPHKPSRTDGAAPTVLTPLLVEQRSPVQVSESRQDDKSAKALAKLYKDGGGVRDFGQDLIWNADLSGKHQRWLGLFVFVLSLSTFGFIVGGVYVARVKVNGPAILDSRKCGLWAYNSSLGGPEAASRAGLHDLQKETRAGEYAQNCYGTPDMFDAMQCNFLYRKRLSFSSPVYTTDCPFKSEICGQNQTVTFTAEVDASDLGINSRHSPKFRRRTSCTPLSMDYPFIQNKTHNGTTTYYYYYGAKPKHKAPLEYTFSTTGDPFESFVPAYELFTYTTPVHKKNDAYWTPRPELTHPEFSTLTLIFVSSLRIFYKRWSEDPIFPADQEVYLPGDQKPWFRNSDPRARPLAYIYNAIEKRLGRGLIAQNKVSQFFSEALGDYHWVDEVERLVATTYAMTQINAWSIASGEDSVHEGKDGYSLKTPEDEYGDLCGMFKYNPPGLPFLWGLSREWPWNKGISDAVESRRLGTSGVGQEGPPQQSTNPMATHSETGETEGVAGASESTSAAPQNSEEEQPTPRLADPAAHQISETVEAPTAIPADDSDDIKWKPLIIGKIISVIFRIAELVFLPLLAALTLGKRLLDFLTGQIGRWWREFTNTDTVDDAGRQA
ncbi:hypothetical protein B7463_g9542, partial [Scytalidium lignicola]